MPKDVSCPPRRARGAGREGDRRSAWTSRWMWMWMWMRVRRVNATAAQQCACHVARRDPGDRRSVSRCAEREHRVGNSRADAESEGERSRARRGRMCNWSSDQATAGQRVQLERRNTIAHRWSMSESALNHDEETASAITGINVTPLVDVTLVLLIIFMVTAKAMVSQAIPMALPTVHTTTAVQTTLAVAVSSECKLTLDGAPMADPDALARATHARLGNPIAAAEARRGRRRPCGQSRRRDRRHRRTPHCRRHEGRFRRRPQPQVAGEPVDLRVMSTPGFSSRSW